MFFVVYFSHFNIWTQEYLKLSYESQALNFFYHIITLKYIQNIINKKQAPNN